jgi:hypothetical protein
VAERLAGLVETSTAIPKAGPTNEHGLSGVIGSGDKRQAPTSVPPEMLMIGKRVLPAFRNNHPHDSGSHGSPVDARILSALKSCDRIGS